MPLSPTIRTGGVGRGGEADRLEDLAHRGALADQLGLGVGRFVGCLVRLFVGPGPQRLDLEGQGTLPQRPLEGQQDLVEVERLGQVVVGPAAHRLDRGGRAAEGGDDDHRQVGERRPELGEHLQAVAAGHLEVEEHGVGLRRVRSGPGPRRRRPPRGRGSPRIEAAGRGCGGSCGRRRRPGSWRWRRIIVVLRCSRAAAAGRVSVKTAPVPLGPVGGAELAAVGQGDLAGDGQAQPGPLGLGREERLEQVADDLGRQARAGVGHAGQDRVPRSGRAGSTAGACRRAVMA